MMLAMAADPALAVERNSPEAEAAYANAPEDMIVELIAGMVCMAPMPRGRHQRATLGVGHALAAFDEHYGGPGDPRGWLFIPEATLHLGARPDKMRADVAGWRIGRARFDLDGATITVAPDWVCEVLSRSTEKHDRGVKTPTLAEHGTEWFWFLDLEHHCMEAHRSERGSLRLVATARAGDSGGLPPFEGVPLARLLDL